MGHDTCRKQVDRASVGTIVRRDGDRRANVEENEVDDFGRVKTFIDVVNAGSFSRAARGMSVSAVTRRVQSLEDELGVRLLHRNTRGLSLTDAGRNFFDRVTGISADLASAISEVKSLQNDVRGLLNVSLRHSAAMIIVPILDQLLTAHPELRIDVIVTDERRDLIANNIDVAVWLGPLPDAVIARRLCPSRRVVCGSPDYLAKYGVPVEPADLKNHNCLRYTPIHAHRWNFSRDDVTEEVEVGGTFSSDNGPALLAAALSNQGLVVVFEWMVREMLERGTLTRVLPSYSVNPHPGDADLYAAWSSSRGMSRKVRVFVDFLIEFFSLRSSG